MRNDWYIVNQPAVMPGIYLFNRFAHAGHYISMNNAQVGTCYQSRTYFSDIFGKKIAFSVPMKSRSLAIINEVILHEPDRMKKSLRHTLQTIYGRCEWYKFYKDSFLESLHSTDVVTDLTLATFNNSLLRWLLNVLELDVIWYDSEIIVPSRPESPSEWISMFGRAIGVKKYLGGKVAQDAYMREADFKPYGMEYQSQSYLMKPYKRTSKSLGTDATISCLDPLFYGGKDLVLELINAPAIEVV